MKMQAHQSGSLTGKERLFTKRCALVIGLFLTGMLIVSHAEEDIDPALTAWLVNQNGMKASSPDNALNALAREITADVQKIGHTPKTVYVHGSGVPSYSTGPFEGNPAYAADLQGTYAITRKPQPAPKNSKPKTGLGPIGVLINGVAMFNAQDAQSYQNKGIWNQDANVFERQSFDSAPGHPAPIDSAPKVQGYAPGIYHHHQNPVALREQMGDDGSKHSPILGFAFDGYPVYGPYGYSNGKDLSGGVSRMRSSYQLRLISDRSTLPSGKKLPARRQGPSIDEIPLGAYIEDYQFVPGTGDLDKHNGRFSVTPEYPNGTYAYFVAVNDKNEGVYPYFIGQSYYGKVKQRKRNMNSGLIPSKSQPPMK